MNRIGTSDDITVTIEDKDNWLMAGVQSFGVKCDIDYEKIGAVGEPQPTDYYIKGRTYTITIKRAFLLNTSLSDKHTVFNKYIWKNFETVIKHKGIDGAKDKIWRFRNCYRVEATQEVDINGSPMMETVTILSHNCGYESDDINYMRRKKMVYGSFVFPYNPESIEYISDRKYVEHKFPGLKYNDVEDFGPNCAILRCTGKLYGSGGSTAWKQLLNEYNKKGARKVYNPIFLNIKKGLMINLKGTVGSGSKIIDYSFDIIQYNPPAVKSSKSSNKKSKKKSSNTGSGGSTGKKTGKVKSKNDLKVGKAVYITGVCCNNSNGGKPHTKKFNHKKMTITKISKSGTHPIHLGTTGWAKVSNLSWS